MAYSQVVNERLKMRLLKISIIVCMMSVSMVLARPGDMDRSFGNEGIAIANIINHNGTKSEDYLYDLAVQQDGKIVAVGEVLFNDSCYFTVTRFDQNGALDTLFSTDGIALFSVGKGCSAQAVSIQHDGKIVAAGYANNDDNISSVVIIRLNANGTLDTSFNDSGIVKTTLIGDDSYTDDIAIQEDGKIVVVGTIFRSDIDFFVMRYEENGSIDDDFGIQFTDFNHGDDRAESVSIQKNGKIVVAGYTDDRSDSEYNENIAVVRYLGNGNRDTTFNGTGQVTFETSASTDYAENIAFDKDNKIILGGESKWFGRMRFTVWKLNDDGSLDTSFGKRDENGNRKGWNVFDIEGSARGMTLQNNGKILLAGNADIEGYRYFALSRLNRDGTLDMTFGDHGVVAQRSGWAEAATLLDGDRCIIGGTDFSKDFILIKYLTGELAMTPVYYLLQ